ncbi:MAG: hypothetical protein A2X02_03095 [Bacteroidetes bacterium GWF2_29_10]|nr:MAG: hypothetical protein A2X02_03095 [Bacteroidetes bacterium GWF2_29_10]
MKYLDKLFLIIAFSICINFVSIGQITVDTSQTIDYLVKDVLLGKGIKVSNVTYTGSKAAIGKFEGTSNIGFEKGIILTSGYATNAIGPNNEIDKTEILNKIGLKELDDIAGYATLDASVLEFDFIPISDTIFFRYVFGSEEYPYYHDISGDLGFIYEPFNDVFGFFVTGENPLGGTYNSKNSALIPGTNLPVTIKRINNIMPSNEQYYVDNDQFPISLTTIQYNGFTKVMNVIIPVVPCQTYHIKIAIADGGDNNFDSGIFLEAGSFSSNTFDISANPSIEGIDKNNVAVEGCVNSIITIKSNRPVIKNTTINYTIGGTATMGIDYSNIPTSVTIPAGSDSARIIIKPLNDAIVEAAETVVINIPISICGDTVSTIIEIKDYQNINLTNTKNDSVCPNDTFKLEVLPTAGLPPYTYLWSNSLNPINPIKTTTTKNTTYTVTVKDICGKTAILNIPIYVKSTPIADAGNNQTIVKGSITELIADGGNTYSWSTKQTDKVIFVNPITTTTYTLTAYKDGCFDSDIVIVTVDNNVVIDAGDNISICKGESVTLTGKGAINSNFSNFTFKGTYNSHRYYYYNNKVKWQQANTICTSNKAYLASINSLGENNFIQSIITDNSLIGGTDSVTEKTWKWINNETFSFTNWNTGEPNNSGNEDYLEIYKSDGKWNDVSSNSLLNFVMEIAPYKWSTGANTDTTVVSPTSTTKYFLTVYNGGSSAIDSVTVTVNEIPVANAGIDQSIYKGNSITLKASGDNTYKYSWSYNNLKTQSITVSPANDYTYIVTVTKNNCSASDDVIVQVKTLVIDAGKNQTICEGETVIIKATGANTYSWNTKSLLDSIVIKPTITTTYKVTGKVINAYAVDSAIITVIPKPIADAGNDTIICAGTNIKIKATGGGTYLWNYNNLTTQSINVNPTINTTYTVTVTKNTCTNTDKVVIKTNPIPIANAGIDYTICEGNKVTLTGSGGGTYLWNNKSTSKSITEKPSITTNYALTVNKLGCTDSDEATVFVTKPPNPSLGSDKRLCKGDYVYIIAQNGDKYSWSNKSTNDSIFVNPKSTQNYIVTVYNGACSASEEIIVNVFNKPIANAGKDIIIFKGDKAILTASGGTSYKWSNGSVSKSINVEPSSTKKYIVTVFKDSCFSSDDVIVNVIDRIIVDAGENISICSGGIAKLSVKGANKYMWSNGDTASSINVSPPITTTYTVTGYTNDASATDNVVVFISNSIKANAGNDIIICDSGKAYLSATGGDKFLWSNDSTKQNIIVQPVTTTTYIVTVFSGNCSASDDVIVEIKNDIIADAGNDMTVCQNSIVSLKATGGETYKWSNGELKQTITLAPTATSTYTVSIYSGVCSATDKVIVYITPLPLISAPDNINICYGMETKITVSGGDYYTWSSGHTVPIITVNPLMNTEYDLTVTKNNCTSSKLINVIVNPPLNVDAGEDQTICSSGFSTLNASGATTYSWNNNSNNQSITVYPSINTIYSVTGYYNGCTASDIVLVTVNSKIKANAGEDQYICYGGKAELKGIGGSSYSWSTGQKTQSITVYPTKDTIFILTVTSGVTCSSIDSIKVFVRDDVFLTAGEDQIICEGDSAHLYARGFGDFIWNNDMTKNIISVSPQYTSTYTVTLTSGTCSKTDDVIVHVINYQNLVINNLEDNYCLNDNNVLIEATPYGGHFTGEIFNNNYFSPSKVGVGIHSVNYSIDSIINLSISIFKDDFGSDKNWTGYNEIWQRAAAKESVGCEGCQDPCSDMTPSQDNYILGTHIGSCYDNGLFGTYYITSPEIDCRDFSDINLSFYRDLGYEGGFWDKVNMSVFDGSKWVDVYRNGVSNHSDNGWVLMSYNVSKYAYGNSRFMVRFGIGPTDATGAYKGWNIDDLTVSGKKKIKCTSQAEKYVRVYGLPQVEAGANETICFGEKINLSGKGGESYLWTPSDYLNKINKQTVLSSPSSDITYQLEVTNAYGCKAIDSIRLSVIPPIIVSSSKDTFEVCGGSSLNISLSGADYYTWLTAEGVSNPYSGNIVLTPTSSRVYKVYGRNVQGCISSVKDIYVFVSPVVNANAGQDISICQGDSVMISAIGGTSYVWSPLLGLSNATVSQTYAKPTITTTYTVTVTDKNLCTATDNIVVKVNALPIVSISKDTSICYGDTAILEVSGGIKYLWEFDVTMDSTSASKVKAFPKHDKTYIVKIINAQECYATAMVKVKVNKLPLVSITPMDYICKGDSATLISSGLSTYTWTPALDIDNANASQAKAAPSVSTQYSVEGKDANGCAGTNSVYVEVRDVKPILSASNDSICLGKSSILKAMGGDSYTWDNSNSLNDSALSIVTASPTITTTYNVTVNKGNCSANASIIVNVLDLPIADAGVDVSVCSGDSVQLNATGGIAYKWNPAEGLNSITKSNPMSSPKINTTYTVTVADKFGCSSTDNVAVIVNTLPEINISTDKSICQGQQSVWLYATAGAAQNTWTPATGVIMTKNDSILVSPTVATTYTFEAKDNKGCVNTASVKVNILSTPKAEAGADKTICYGKFSKLTGSGANYYQWLPLDGLSANNIASPNASPSTDTKYYLTITDNNGCTDNDSVFVKVNSLPIISVIKDTMLCLKDSIMLSATGGVTYSWSPATGLINTKIANPKTSPSVSTLYTVSVTDANGCVSTEDAYVKVKGLPVVTITGINEICIYDSTKLIAKSNTAIKYQWSNTGGISDILINNPKVKPTTTNTYKLTVTDANACSSSTTYTLKVNPLPTIVMTPDTTICINDFAYLSGNGGVRYEWKQGDGKTIAYVNAINVKPTVTSSYSLMVTSNKGCVNEKAMIVSVNSLPVLTVSLDTFICRYDSATLNVYGANTYKWTPVAELSNSKISNPKASPSLNTLYSVIGTDINGCKNTATTNVYVRALPKVTTTGSTAICINDSAYIGANGGEYYSWAPATAGINDVTSKIMYVNPTATTNYTVTVTDIYGCSAKKTLKVTVYNLPIVTITKDTNICFGKTINMLATGGVKYLWLPVDGLNKSNVANPKANPTVNTTYNVTVIDTNSCVNTATVKVFVNPLPLAYAGEDATICQGGKTQFVGAGGYSYKWAPAATLDNANIMNPFANPTSNTVYKVSVYSDKGCVSVDSLEVFVNPIPKANAGNDTAICYGNSIKLKGLGSINYLWTPNYAIDDKTSATPTVSPSVKTSYVLKVMDNIGCSSQDTVIVTVNPIPTASASDDKTICYGDTIILTVIGESLYSWSNDASLSKADIWNPKAFPANSTMYSVTVTNMYGCIATDEVYIGVKDFNPLTVKTTYYPVVCDGNAVNVLIDAGKGYTEYTWSTAANTSSINVKESDKYKVTVNSTNGCNKEVSIDVIAHLPSPSPNVRLRGDSLLCYNDSAYLYLDSLYLQYHWSSGSTTDSIKINTKGQYSVTVTDYNNCVIVSDTIMVDVINTPIALVSSIQLSDSVVKMKNFSLYADKYKWYVGNGTTDSVAEPEFNVIPDSIYNVLLVASNKCGVDTADVLVKNSGTTNITQLITDNNLTMMIYPNPTSNFVNIEGDINVLRLLNIKLYTQTGQLVYEQQNNKAKTIKQKINISNFENGLYILEINIDGTKYYNRIVKL